MRIASVLAILFAIPMAAVAQRYVDVIDRGLVAVPATSGNLVSWRVFGEEYYDTTYNLYINGALAAEGLEASDYLDTTGGASTTYAVAPVIRGVEGDKCDAVTRWAALDSTGGVTIPVQNMTGRDGSDVNSHYTLNDVTLGDLTGDGVVEFIVKRPCDLQLDTSQSNCFNALDAYDLSGKRLWWIDMGPNMCSGPDEQWDCVAYDWDLDGKAEVLLRGVDNMIIHSAEGDYVIGDNTVDTRNTVTTSNSNLAYTNTGNEYLLYLDGETGVPYSIGSGSTPYWIDYPNPRGSADDWGDSYGHRSTKHYWGAPYLDGRHPSIFLGRGCYTKHMFKAFDVDPATHQLTQRWAWECSDSSSPWYGNGFHNFAIADVDWDGKDEIVFGSMIIDDNGMGLCTTGLGHGDAQHCSNFNPYRHGQQQFTCNEDNPSMQFYDATTGEMLYRSVGSADDGRALMGNFTNDYPGSVGRSSTLDDWIGAISCKVIDALGGDNFIDWSDLNQRIYWDGDLLDEYFDSPGTEREGRIYKPGSGTAYMLASSLCSNGSKNDPGAIADIFGDWREELVMRKSDNSALLVYTTPVYTEYRLPTLWSDHQYRNSIVWQSMGYNQPPHKSYFLGELEGITVAPPPLIMTGRKELTSGDAITTCDDHLLMCTWGNTNLSITDGASPYMVTFYIPSDVAGNADSNTKSTPEPTYSYYECTVTGGALTGSTRVVKQGDGILTLPTATMTYTGETNIWAGTLNFDGTLTSSPLWLNRFAELNSDGGTFTTIQADYAAVIRPGKDGKISSITADAITLGFGSHIEIDVDCSTYSADQINATTLTIDTRSGSTWETYGPKYLVPIFDIIATNTVDGKLAEGEYILGTVDNVIGNLSDIKIIGIAGQAKTLSINDNNQLVLTVEGIRDATTIYWNGSESSSWNYASDSNFLNDDNEEDIFVTGDIVYFTDDAQTYSVSLTDDLDPAAVIIDADGNYTFSGTGSLTGEMTLTKSGSGTLTIGNDNTYTGTTTISGGTVKVSSMASSTQSAGNLGSTDSGIYLSHGAILQPTSAVSIGATIYGDGDEGGVINNSSEVVMEGALRGTILEKKGNGTMKVNKSNNVDTLIITKGDVEIVAGKPATTVLMNGGSLTDDVGSTSHAIVCADGTTSTWNLTATSYISYANRLYGSGTLKIVPRNTVNRGKLTGNWSEFTGTINYSTTGITLPLSMSNNMPHATFNISSDCEVSNCGASTSAGRTLQIGAVTGKGDLREYYTDFNSQSSISGTTTTWQIGNDDGNDFTYAGHIVDSGSNKCAFEKVGSCTMTMTGSSSFQGTAKVTAGTLILNSSGSNAMLGTSALTVNNGALLAGKGQLTNSKITVDAGGTLCCGTRDEDDENGAGTAGVLNVNGCNVVVDGTLEMHISASTSTVLAGAGTVTINDVLCLKGDVSGLEIGDEVQIIDAKDIVFGDGFTFQSYVTGNKGTVTWDDSRLSEGILIVADIPDSIITISIDDLDNASVYTLGGIKINGKPTQKGVYIVNGKKAVIK